MVQGYTQDEQFFFLFQVSSQRRRADACAWDKCRKPKRLRHWSFSRVNGQSERPEVIGVPSFVAGGGDRDTPGWGKEAFGFAQIIAKDVVDGLMDRAIFIGLEELGG
jgi:hypothetical protein